jgi:4-hydroxybenzoate polyprenyltransferase
VHPTTGGTTGGRSVRLPLALVAACHPGPTLAVTVLTALLALSGGTDWRTGLLVVCAVLAGQLSIGWSNDLLDAERDRASGRADKPVAAGAVPARVLRPAIGGALVLCVALSLAAGLLAGAVHLLGVAMGWAHNLGVKRTVLSPLPYAVAFASLPAFVWLAGRGGLPPAWLLACGAVLGVAAHLLNALPDLADDVATGVVGLPQRLGGTGVRVLAPVLLLVGTALAVVRPGEPGGVPGWGWVVLALGAVLALVAARRAGRVPFVAAVGVALLCVALLVVRSG